MSLGIGAAAGTALSPLPWKITDDLSIWSQNWPWTPVPQDGEATYVNSVCTLCPGGCGISVRKIDDRAVKIEGMKGFPINDGGICILGLSGLQLLYGPTRIASPLKRTGKRGEGAFQAVSWKQAISEVVDKLSSLRKEGKPHTVAGISGEREGTTGRLFKRFLTAYGSPNFMHVPSAADASEQVLYLMHGQGTTLGMDLENADYILSFSAGLLDGWGSPVRMFKANSRLKDKKGKLVQIEPRLSSTAAKADKWLPITPGAEGALALGLAHVIIAESLHNREFIENYTSGFEAFANYVRNGFSPDIVAQITGIPKAGIVSLAREFAGASRPVAICGRGQGDTPGALCEAVAVHALNALVGNINRTGGVWSVAQPVDFNWSQVWPDEPARMGLARKRIDGAGGPLLPQSLLNRFPQAVNGKNPYEVQALLVSNANPLYTMRDVESVKKAFDRIGFIVSFSSYMDETAQYSDLILPNHHYLERYEVVEGIKGMTSPFIGMAKPVVKPLYNTRHTADVIIELASELKGTVAAAFPWASYEACLKQTLGYKVNALAEDGYWMDGGYMPPDWSNAFKTPSGKFEFNLSPFKHKVYTHPEGDPSIFPLVLIPYDSLRLANDQIGNAPFMTKTVADTVLQKSDAVVEINPETGKQLRLAEGSLAVLKTPKKTVKVAVHLSQGVGPGIVAVPRGLGHLGNDRYLAGKGVNVNDLIGPVDDVVSGLDAAWGIRASLAKS